MEELQPPSPLNHTTANLPPDHDLQGAGVILRYGLAMLFAILGPIYTASGHPELAEQAMYAALAVVGVGLALQPQPTLPEDV